MKLKICGLKYSDNIKQIAELNPDFMGFTFYEGSKRFVGNDFVMPQLPVGIKRIGVFVNADESYILEVVKKYSLHYVQLHGDESPAFCKQISKSVNVIKAFGVDKNFELTTLNEYKPFCSFFLFDNKTLQFEGSGEPLDLEILKDYDNTVPYFIAGGMDLQKFRKLETLDYPVYGIDVNAKFEIKPGYKDIIRIIQIKNNIH